MNATQKVLVGIGAIIFGLMATCGAINAATWIYGEIFGDNNAMPTDAPANPPATPAPTVVPATAPTDAPAPTSPPTTVPAAINIGGCQIVKFTNESWQNHFAANSGQGQEGLWTKFSLQRFNPNTIIWVESLFTSETSAPFVRLFNSQWFIPYRIREGDVTPVGVYQRSSEGLVHEFSMGQVHSAFTQEFVNPWPDTMGFFLAPRACQGQQLIIEDIIDDVLLPYLQKKQRGWKYFSLGDEGMHPEGLTVDD
jgi:hypothetical protein